MCDCIKRLNEELAPKGQCVDATMLAEPQRIVMPLIRTDKYTADKRRDRPTHLIAGYCPMCGEKYAHPDGVVL